MGLAHLYGKTGRHEQAEQRYRQALSIREQALGPEHSEVAEVLNHHAEFYARLGEDARAQSYYKRALRILALAVGPEHPATAISLHGLATLDAREGKESSTRPCDARTVARSPPP